MRTLDLGFKAHVQSGATTLATCWKLTRTDSGVLGFTDHDETISFGGTVFDPVSGMDGGERAAKLGASADTTEVVGILDSEATSAAVDLFYYYGSASRQIQFQIGQTLVLDVALSLGTWHYLAQVCANNTLTAYVDGAKVGERTGCAPGDAGTRGLQIGQNNTGGSNGDQWLVGAIDGLRLWTAPLSAAAICQASDRTDC